MRGAGQRRRNLRQGNALFLARPLGRGLLVLLILRVTIGVVLVVLLLIRVRTARRVGGIVVVVSGLLSIGVVGSRGSTATAAATALSAAATGTGLSIFFIRVIIRSTEDCITRGVLGPGLCGTASRLYWCPRAA